MRKLSALVLTIALLLTATAGYAQATSNIPGFTQLSAETLEGGTFTQADLAEKDLTVLNIWATTCPPCITEMPHLAALEKKLPENVRLLTLCLDAGRMPEAVKNFLKQVGYEGITLLYSDQSLVNFVSAIQYTPTTVFLNSAGEVVGAPMIGSPRNLEAAYLEAINRALTAEGKPVISLEEAL